MNYTKATGLDEIPGKLVKIDKALASPYTIVISEISSSGIFPVSWKNPSHPCPQKKALLKIVKAGSSGDKTCTETSNSGVTLGCTITANDSRLTFRHEQKMLYRNEVLNQALVELQ